MFQAREYFLASIVDQLYQDLMDFIGPIQFIAFSAYVASLFIWCSWALVPEAPFKDAAWP